METQGETARGCCVWTDGSGRAKSKESAHLALITLCKKYLCASKLDIYNLVVIVSGL